LSLVVEAALAALIPGVISGLVVLCSERFGASLAALALPLAYFSTHTFLLGLPELGAGAVTERLPWIALLFGVLFLSFGQRPGRLGRTLLLFGSLFAVWWVTESARANQLSVASGVQLICLLLLLCLASSQLAAPIARVAERWTAPALVALVALFLAPSLVLGRSAVLGQLSGAICAASVAAAVVSWFRGTSEAGGLVAAVAAPMLVLLAACGALYAYLDPWSAACFGAAVLAIAVGLKRGGGWSHARAVGVVSALCLLGAWLAYQGAPAPTPYDY